jgi:hypothetical protein
MKISNHIAAFYQPGLLIPQGQSRPQPEPERPQETQNNIQDVRKLAPSLDEQTYARLRARYEQMGENRVTRDGMTEYARKAINAYGRVGQAADQDYASNVLGIDLYV